MRGIPFKLPDVGLREIGGTLYLDDDYLIFDVVDALAGDFDKDHQVIKVDPKALDEIYLDHGLISDRLFIRPKRDDLLKAMPGTYGIALPLKIRRKYRTRAEDLIEEVRRRGTSTGGV